MLKKLAFIFSLFLIAVPVFSKKKYKMPTWGMEAKLGPAFNIFDSKTNTFIRNHIYTTGHYCFFYKNLFIETTISFRETNVKNDIVIRNTIFLKKDELNVSFRKFLIGYKVFIDKSISVDPYFGWLKSDIKDSDIKPVMNTTKGYTGGFTLPNILNKKIQYTF